jgi:hypothetical protein
MKKIFHASDVNTCLFIAGNQATPCEGEKNRENLLGKHGESRGVRKKTDVNLVCQSGKCSISALFI